MLVTTYAIAFILLVLYLTYPKEFPVLLSDPKLLVDVISLECRRRWMILKLGTMLWISKQRLAYSLWRMQDIIAKEQIKQQQQEINID